MADRLIEDYIPINSETSETTRSCFLFKKDRVTL